MGSAKDGVIVTGMGIFWHEVAENSGALPWRIADSRVSGFVYESGDVDALTKKIQELADMPDDERQTIGAKSRELMERWVMQDLGQSLSQYFDQINSSSRPLPT